MAAKLPIRVAISGAAGRIGYSLVFRIANGGLFGPDQPVTLSMLDLPEAVPRLDACALELSDCSFPLLSGLHVGADPVAAFQGADWVILLGGESSRIRPAQRLNLLRQNAPVMIAHGRAINLAAPAARVLVVVSPCNTNCLVAMSHAQDVPRDHWFALNQLIRMRATAILAAKAGVPVTQVSRLTVWGNNSDRAYVDLRNARIGNLPASQVIDDPAWEHTSFEFALEARFHEVLRLSGTMPAGSAVQAVLASISAISSPTPFEHWFGAGVLSDGSYGVPRGLVFGFPLLTADGKTWSIAQGHYIDEHAQDRINRNVTELEHEAAAVSHLLGKV